MQRFTGADDGETVDRSYATSGAFVQSTGLDALVVLESIGSRRSFTRNQEIFAEGDSADSWFKVVSGAVRACNLMADGRRQIGKFNFAGDCFGFDNMAERLFAAEAMTNVTVIRYPRPATERLIDENPALALCLRDMIVRDLADAQIHIVVLGRMWARERVASFLLDLFDRCALDLPVSYQDIADYLGLTTETVCRTLSAFKRDGVIAIPSRNCIVLRDRDALSAIRRGLI